MLRVIAMAALAAVSACAPGPAHMPASHASEVLERFAAGAGEADVCTPNGRAMLRGAVRAYGAAMNANGVAWPATGGDQLNGVEASVLVAFSAGFVEASDFYGPARAALTQLAFTQWPEVRGMRTATRVACAEVAALQQAAARVLMETARLHQIPDSRPGRLQRQRERVERARIQMQQQAAFVSARVGAARES
jgi:hypothetical protein